MTKPHRLTARAIVLCTLAGLLSGAAAAAGPPLRLLRVSPAGDEFEPGQQIVFKFDRDMVPLGGLGRTFKEIPIEITPTVPCQWRWIDTTELACRLTGQQRLRPATKYSITVGTDLVALDGSRLPKPATQEFTTLLPKPSEAELYKWATPTRPYVELDFNLPVTAASVEKHVAFDGRKQGSVPVRVAPVPGDEEGYQWLPVPGQPGVLIQIYARPPTRSQNNKKMSGSAWTAWLASPVTALAPATTYQLRASPGLVTPLGNLPGTGGGFDEGEVTTFGSFAFAGIACGKADGSVMIVAPAEKQNQRCNAGTVGLAFTAPVPASTLAAAEWNPSPEGVGKDFSNWWRAYRVYSSDSGLEYLRDGSEPFVVGLPFDFAPMSRYSVTVPAGVIDRFGRRLDKAARVTFFTGHRAPFVSNVPYDAVLEADQPTAVPLRFTNLKKLDFTFRLAQGLSEPADKPRKAHPTTVSVLQAAGSAVKEDAIVSVPLGVREALGGKSGALWGKLHWAPKRDQWSSATSDIFAQVTPWDVLAKRGPFGTLVWVTSFKTGAPVAGARVAYYIQKRDRRWSLERLDSHAPRTDANGLALLPAERPLIAKLPERDQENRDYIGVVRRGDVALLPLQDGWFDLSGYAGNDFPTSDWGWDTGSLLSFWAVTEQGIYHPGSDVNFALFARQNSNRGPLPPSDLDYSLKIFNQETGSTLREEHNLKMSRFGGIHGTVHVPSTAPAGWYSIDVNVPGQDYPLRAGGFRVSDFVAASYSVHASLSRSRFRPGEAGTAAIAATLHAGGAYGNASAKYLAAIVPVDFSPGTPVTAGYTFGSNTEDAENVPLLESGTQLDAVGKSSTSFTVPVPRKVLYGKIVFEASVESPRGTWVSNVASAPYEGRNRFVGIRMDNWLLTVGKAERIHFLVVDPDGNPVAGAAVQIALQRGIPVEESPDESAENPDETPKMKWVTESSCSATSTTAPGICELTPSKAGDYRVAATVTDTFGRRQRTTLETWAVGSGAIAWNKSQSITLVPDKATYRPGDTAHILVQNPYPNTNALVTVERYGVMWKKVVRLKGHSPIVDIPIAKEYFPGAFLSVAIAKPRTAPPGVSSSGNPDVAMGYVKLPVGGRGKSLDVTVKPAAAVYKPRQTVNVDVRVRTASGSQPPKTRLVVAVVDQGVLDLLEQGKDYYDPRAHFYESLDYAEVDNRVLVEALSAHPHRVEAGMMAAPPNAMAQLSNIVVTGSHTPAYALLYAGMRPTLRTVFKDSAYWNPTLETDGQGRAHFSFQLPDNLTRWRIFVIAMTPGAAMGLGDASVRVSLPIQLEAALPNQVHAGDRFDAGFSVANRTASKRSIATQVQANGPIAGGSQASRSVFGVEPNDRAFAWLPLLTQQPGTIHLTATATAGTLGDAMAATIPVRSAETPVVDASYGSTTGAATSVPVRLPPKAVPGSVKVSVTLAPTLLGNLGPVFENLRDDPLEFWEVRLSRAVMASNYLELKPVLPDSVSWPSASADIEQALAAASDFQAPNGGMAFWVPRGDFVSPYLSVYTALAFDWLKAAGHPPPPAVVAALDGYLRKQILDVKPKKDGKEDPTAPILRAGALLALAPGGIVPKDAVAAMLPDLPKLDLFGKALLLEATVELKDTQSAATIARMLLSQAEESAGSISLNETQSDAYTSLLATPVRANCAALDALSLYAHTAAGRTLAGDVPEKLARWIAGRRRDAGAWLNSQENVFCTTALAHYSDTYEASVRSLDGRVSLGSHEAGGARFESRRSAPKTIPVPPPASAANTPARVAIARSGTGRLYYGVQLRYAEPAGTAGPVDAGFTVKRRYYVQHGADWTPVGPDTQLARGDIVRVDLDVDAPTERHYVVLTDPLPGAFEAVNRNLATSARSLPHAEPGTAVLWFDYGPWPDFSITTGGFYHRETAFDAVRFYADNLPAGHYRLIYSAQVISPGTFVAPPPVIKEIYQPDVFGRGQAARFKVVLQKD